MLAAAPQYFLGTPGNVIPVQALQPLASITASVDVGNSIPGAVGGRLQVVGVAGPTISSINGLRVQLFSSSDGMIFDTLVYVTGPIFAFTSSGQMVAQSTDIHPGIYKLMLTNLDAVNAINVQSAMAITR